MFLEGPHNRREFLKDFAPIGLENEEKILEFLRKKVSDRLDRGIENVDSSIFPTLFGEDLRDELVARFNVTLNAV